MSEATASPTSWRDVYALVRDQGQDILKAVEKVDAKVDGLTKRVDDIEEQRAIEAAVSKTAHETAVQVATVRNRKLVAIVTASRSTIALLISAVAVLITLFKS